MTARRSRTVAAAADDVWAVVSDPWQLPRWWPRTKRVEAVSPDGWTSVLGSNRGRSVRADWRLEAGEGPRAQRWVQEVEGTPFERIFAHHSVHVAVEPADGGAAVHLRTEQRARGWARLVPWMVRRAAKRQMDEALGALAGLVEA